MSFTRDRILNPMIRGWAYYHRHVASSATFRKADSANFDLKDSYFVRMKAAGMSMIPTLKLFGRAQYLWEILSVVGWYSREGGQILFGTDVGFLTDYDPTEEYVLMSRAGLSFTQILESLTTAPAKRFGLAKRTGRIAPGMDADVVLLGSDPATDIKAHKRTKFRE